ncbi:MAG: transposase [Rhodobacteraceae bacterium]|nr:transposase [Paracoccaceae bacterium]
MPRIGPYSATVHDDPEGNGPTSAAARHECRAGQLFQLRTGTAQFIRQEGAAGLDIPAPARKQDSVHLVVDSTGLKVFGEGERKVRQHGWSKRRLWRKLHLGVDQATGMILTHKLTLSNVHPSHRMRCIRLPGSGRPGPARTDNADRRAAGTSLGGQGL